MKNEIMLLCPWKNKDKWVSTGSSEHPPEGKAAAEAQLYLLFLWMAVISRICWWLCRVIPWLCRVILDPWPWNLFFVCYMLLEITCSLKLSAKHIFHCPVSAVIPFSYFVSSTWSKVNCNRASLYFLLLCAVSWSKFCNCMMKGMLLQVCQPFSAPTVVPLASQYVQWITSLAHAGPVLMLQSP